MIAGYEYGTESDTEDDEAVVEELMSDDSIGMLRKTDKLLQ